MYLKIRKRALNTIYWLIFIKFRKIDSLYVFLYEIFYRKSPKNRPLMSLNDRLSTIKFFFNDDLIIQTQYPGLGDHLFLSTLPEVVKHSSLFKKVYISTRSPYRFKGIKEIIWKNNPYVDGFTNLHGWIHYGSRPTNGNFIDGINQIFLNKRTFLENPKVYQYHGNLEKENLSNCILVDFGRFSNKQSIDINAAIQIILNRYPENRILLFSNFKQANSIFEKYKKIELIPIPLLFKDYCAMALSVKTIFCFYSGLNSLSPALGLSANVFCEQYDSTISHMGNKYIVLNDE